MSACRNTAKAAVTLGLGLLLTGCAVESFRDCGCSATQLSHVEAVVFLLYGSHDLRGLPFRIDPALGSGDFTVTLAPTATGAELARALEPHADGDVRPLVRLGSTSR